MNLCTVFALGLIFFNGTFLFVHAIGDEERRQQGFMHPLTNMPDGSSDIKTSYYFPKHPDQKFPIGEMVTVLCHLSNEGQYPYNITAIMGSLNSPVDFSFHIQNYSYKPLGVVVKSGEEYTFDYQFQLHQNLEPVEYALAHTIFYEDDSESFSTTFFNRTVELYYPNSEYDLETIGQLSFSFIATLVIGFLVYYSCGPEGKQFSKSKSTFGTRKVRKQSTEADDTEWVDEHIAAPKKRAAKKT